jgi:hypothetical protein
MGGLTKKELDYRKYLQAEDNEQYDIVRDRWSKLNWELLDKCDEAVAALQKGDSPAKISPLVISAGIGYDKLYAKRTEQSKPLSMPVQLIEMVRKGLRLGSNQPAKPAVTPQYVVGHETVGEDRKERTIEGGIAQRNQPQSDNDDYVNSKSNDCASLSDRTVVDVVGQHGSTSQAQDLPQVAPADQGGVACADLQPSQRGQGPSLSRQPQQTPQISQPIKTPARAKVARSPAEETERRRLRGLANRERLRQQRADRIAAVKRIIKETVPYQRPSEKGGLV